MGEPGRTSTDRTDAPSWLQNPQPRVVQPSPRPPDRPLPSSAGPPARPRGPALYTGVAHDVRSRIDKRWRLPGEQVISFRLERWDDGGEQLPPLSVEMRGYFLSGGLTAGERVEVRGHVRGGVLVASRVHSLTTGGVTSVRPSDWLTLRLGRNGAITAVLLVLSVLLLIVRFTPDLYAQTPFGLHDYRQVVLSTCGQTTDIAKNNKITHAALGPLTGLTPGDPAQLVFVDRAEILPLEHESDDSTLQALQGLLDTPAPLLLHSQRARLAGLLPNLQALNSRDEDFLATLPAKVSLAALVDANLRTKPADDAVTLGLTNAMSSLAGQVCTVNLPRFNAAQQ